MGGHLSQLGVVWLQRDDGLRGRSPGRLHLCREERRRGVGLEGQLKGGILLTTLDAVTGWARKNSIWPLGFGLACCAIEMMSTFASRFDLSRFGMEVMRASPRQADLMIVAGRVSVEIGPA